MMVIVSRPQPAPSVCMFADGKYKLWAFNKIVKWFAGNSRNSLSRICQRRSIVGYWNNRIHSFGFYFKENSTELVCVSVTTRGCWGGQEMTVCNKMSSLRESRNYYSPAIHSTHMWNNIEWVKREIVARDHHQLLYLFLAGRPAYHWLRSPARHYYPGSESPHTRFVRGVGSTSYVSGDRTVTRPI